MWEDPIVKEVREAGDKLAKKCDYDLHKFSEYLKKKQRKHLKRLVSKKPKFILKKTGTTN